MVKRFYIANIYNERRFHHHLDRVFPNYEIRTPSLGSPDLDLSIAVSFSELKSNLNITCSQICQKDIDE
jgi:hypothetical protein